MDYGYNWARQREACLERYNNTCLFCGKKSFRDLHVHHIIPLKEFEIDYGFTKKMDFRKANRLRNLIPLCASCHGKSKGKKYEKIKQNLTIKWSN